MTLDDITSKYYEKSAEIQVTQMIVKGSSNNEFQKLCEQTKLVNSNSEGAITPSATYVATFRKLINGQLISYGRKHQEIDDLKMHIVIRKNKQFCWLLAEAYEVFEDFIEEIYAYIGFMKNETWPLRDFGEITLLDLPTKDFAWFLNRVEQKKDKPGSILNRLRTLYPEISKIETTNAYEINARLFLTLIEKLRHIIVHKNGVVTNKALFIEKVLKDSALYNNGKYDNDHKEFIESFFGTGQYENLISLLEIQTDSTLPFAVYHDVFSQLSGFLVAYASYVYEAIKNREISEAQQLTNLISPG